MSIMKDLYSLTVTNRTIRRPCDREALVSEMFRLLDECRELNLKKSRWYFYVRQALVQQGYRPFDIMTAFQHVAHGYDWESARKIAAAIARRKRW